jgi:hypothetical protein
MAVSRVCLSLALLLLVVLHLLRIGDEYYRVTCVARANVIASRLENDVRLGDDTRAMASALAKQEGNIIAWGTADWAAAACIPLVVVAWWGMERHSRRASVAVSSPRDNCGA